MQLLRDIAAWLVAAVGTIGLLILAMWLLDVLVDRAMTWWGVKDIFVAFCFDRHKCTCGAVGKKRDASMHKGA